MRTGRSPVGSPIIGMARMRPAVVHQGPGAGHGGFLVGSGQQDERLFQIRCAHIPHCLDRQGQKGLHVGCAETVQALVCLGQRKRVVLPFACIKGHGIGMSGQHQPPWTAAQGRNQVGLGGAPRQRHDLNGTAAILQPGGQQVDDRPVSLVERRIDAADRGRTDQPLDHGQQWWYGGMHGFPHRVIVYRCGWPKGTLINPSLSIANHAGRNSAAYCAARHQPPCPGALTVIFPARCSPAGQDQQKKRKSRLRGWFIGSWAGVQVRGLSFGAIRYAIAPYTKQSSHVGRNSAAYCAARHQPPCGGAITVFPARCSPAGQDEQKKRKSRLRGWFIGSWAGVQVRGLSFGAIRYAIAPYTKQSSHVGRNSAAYCAARHQPPCRGAITVFPARCPPAGQDQQKKRKSRLRGGFIDSWAGVQVRGLSFGAIRYAIAPYTKQSSHVGRNSAAYCAGCLRSVNRRPGVAPPRVRIFPAAGVVRKRSPAHS